MMRFNSVLAASLMVLALGLSVISGSEGILLHRRQARQATTYACTAPGFFASPDGDVTKYYRCLMVGGRWYYYLYKCPTGSGFVPDRMLCVTGVTNVPTTSTPAATSADPATTPGATTPAETTTTTMSTTAPVETTTPGNSIPPEATTPGATTAPSDITTPMGTTAPVETTPVGTTSPP